MSMDFGRALDEITVAAQGAVRPVQVDGIRARVRRRRTQGVALRSVGGVAVVGAVVASLSLLGGGPGQDAIAPVGIATVTTVPSPTPTPTPTAEPATPLPGWVAGGAPCSAPFELEPVDAPTLEVQGAVVIGQLDRTTAMFAPDPAGTTLFLDVLTTTDVPGLAAGDGLARLTTVLVDEHGTVAFWSDPAREIPQFDAADDSHISSMSGMYDAVDCRTGRPLTGTYRVFAHDEGGPETVELAPVTFGPDGTHLPQDFGDSLPVCGQPPPDVPADLTVSIDPGVELDDVNPGGLHAPVTVTATGPGRLAGRVPQSLHAVLVDEQGRVATRPHDPMSRRYDSGATFDVGAGESFPAEVFQWFAGCGPADGTRGALEGSYDLYVYDVVLAGDGSGDPSPRVLLGGPFPVTLR